MGITARQHEVVCIFGSDRIIFEAISYENEPSTLRLYPEDLLKEYSPENIRNISIIGHGGAGKTVFGDAALFTCGAITRIGRIEDGTTISDYHPDEISRQISINSTLLIAEHRNCKINMIDTPGFSDFTGEVTSALRVSDTALLLIKAVEGVEVGSELVWKYTVGYETPTIIVINKMDNENADFDAAFQHARERFGPDVTLAQFPVNKGLGFSEFIDLIRMKKYSYANDGSGKFTEADIPAELMEKATQLHEQLIEKVAESDENLLNLFFEQGTLPEAELIRGFRTSLMKRQIFPVFCMAGSKNIGVKHLLDFIVDFSPTPTEHGKAIVHGTDSKQERVLLPDPTSEVAMFIFKTISEQHVGELSFFRMYSGTLNPGVDLVNQSTGKVERINQIFSMNGKDRKEVSRLLAGDIGAVVKLKDSHTNNTLAPKTLPVKLDPIHFPEPLVSAAITPKAKGDEDKIGTGLHTLHEEDPSFKVVVDGEIKQTIISGQGEIHLDVMVKRLKQRFGVDVEVSQPRIPYRETIKGKSDVSYKHKKQSGGAGQYGEVYIKIEPKPRGTGYEFVDAIVGGVVGNKFIPAVDKGVVEIMAKGVLAGYPVVDVRVTLYDGSQHPVDSNEISFKIAGMQAFKKGFLEAKPMMLEPIYTIEVIVPDEFMGDVMGDISSRRGKIQGMDSDGGFQVIKAIVPLAELHSYASQLRSMSQGRGLFRRAFSHYDEVPREIMDKIIEEAKAQKEEES